ncbi:Sjogren's syndrome/scleroderma autoantigen 1 family protein [Halalkalicoccus salilacus]|uniref:Sjogren's syndrome/scleroderma autoantigen 1 family protein n=1 Tax=Halalkalicoccus salilacus TaxID=3117459 RepID=UPI00300ECADF
MSEFDKEAEREKLRRKYEAEQEDRQATQRMSELLLQGATMTNHHCDDCGDPMFRYEGQEFCPSCQAGGQPSEAAAHRSEPRPERESPEPAETAPESESEARRFADEEREVPTDTSSQPSEVREANAESTGSPEAVTTAEPTAEPAPSASGDLDGARNALAETITRLSRRASNAEDPRRAREFLEAAGEAAAVLETLDGR